MKHSQHDVNVCIGMLDHGLSLLKEVALDPTLDAANRQTVKHHAEDCIGLGRRVLEILESKSQPQVENKGYVEVSVTGKQTTCPQICVEVGSPSGMQTIWAAPSKTRRGGFNKYELAQAQLMAKSISAILKIPLRGLVV